MSLTRIKSPPFEPRQPEEITPRCASLLSPRNRSISFAHSRGYLSASRGEGTGAPAAKSHPLPLAGEGRGEGKDCERRRARGLFLGRLSDGVAPLSRRIVVGVG